MAGRTSVDQEQLARARARIGTTLGGKYRLDALLGLGGMAAVYRATHRNAAVFAVKVLHAEYALRSDVRARFLREGYIANSIHHPGAVRVVDDESTPEGEAYIVMELLEGASVELLADRIGGVLPVRAVVAMALRVLDVLEAAHVAGVVHRDIKPANVFIGHDGRVVLLDFGIARVYDSALAGGMSTAAGAVLGTPAFMAPEQALAQKSAVGPRADLWALGATAFAAATGRTVHLAEGAAQFLVLAATRSAQPIRDVLADVPQEIAAVIDRALALQAEDRWADAADMRAALREAARAAYGSVPGPADLALLFAQQAKLAITGQATAATTHAAAATLAAGGRHGAEPPAAKGFFRAVVATVRGLGVDADAALVASGLDPEEVAAGLTPTNEEFVRFFEESARVSGDPALGVKIGISLPLGSGGALDYATRTSSTYGDAVARMVELYAFLSDRMRFALEERGDVVDIAQQRIDGAPSGPQITEFVTSLFLVRSREVLGHALPVVSISFMHSAQEGKDLAATFGAPVAFGQASDHVTVPRKVLEQRLATSDPHLAELLERHTRHQTGRPTGGG